MNRLLLISSGRFFAKQPWQLALAIIGVALGVAIVVGVELANTSAQHAFERSTSLVVGKTTHQLIAPDSALPEEIFTRLRTEMGIARAAPVIEGTVRLEAMEKRSLRLLGLDVFNELPVRDYLGLETSDIDINQLLTMPNTVIITQALATRLSVKKDDTIKVFAAGNQYDVHIVGLLSPDPSQAKQLEYYIFADIATAQELLNLQGLLSRIDLILDDQEAQRLATADLGGAELMSAAARSNAIAEMTRAFRINLTALSLLALLVGMFLIYAIMSFLVVQRRGIIGIYRCMGVTQGQILLVILLEAIVIGTLGTLIGLVLGVAMGMGLVQLILRTMQDLYLTSVIVQSGLDLWVLVKGALLGIFATVFAALQPAVEAARTPARITLNQAFRERKTRSNLPITTGLAVVCLLGAGVLLGIGQPSLVPAFGGIFCILLAAALLVPFATIGCMRLVRFPLTRLLGTPGKLAVGSVVASLSRTGVAVAALMIAIATLIGVGVMISSFRSSVSDWLEVTLQSDYYFTLDNSVPAITSTAFSDDTLQELSIQPGVTGLSLVRWLRVPSRIGEVRVRAMQPGPHGWGLLILAGTQIEAPSVDSIDPVVMISEPLANKHKLGVGDTVALRTAGGMHEFAVSGIYRDYASDQGALTLHLDTYRHYWRDRSLTGVGVYLATGIDTEHTRAALEHFVAKLPGVSLVANHEVREASLAIFDRTFTITQLLRWVCGAVAFFGILSALMALQLERAREFAIFRAMGFTPLQVRQVILTQTGLLGLTAGLFALPLGIALAALLVFVINERAFGWSMAFEVPPLLLAQGVLVAVCAALLAGIYPAYRLTRTTPAKDLRQE